MVSLRVFCVNEKMAIKESRTGTATPNRNGTKKRYSCVAAPLGEKFK